jgi:small basic protein
VTTHLVLAAAVTTAVLSASTIASILVAIVIPFVTDLITKSRASHAIKAAVATVLAALTGALTTVAFNEDAGWKAYLWNIAIAFVMTMTVHRTGASAPVQRRTATFGLGAPRRAAADRRAA